MKISLLTISLLTLLGGCSHLSNILPNETSSYAGDDLTLFAYDLGATHAGLAKCPSLSSFELDAHFESAVLALKGQAGPRLAELSPAFRRGLREPAGLGQRLSIPCECANELVNESRLHNLRLYRGVTLPRAYPHAN